ncbi:MAG TPA: type IV toxin-antitoxin system AbiEi family antitoxin domain-containing protein [Solirubrobacterales bacterium]|nr:type IV toxin-antitoxin system AbiEi family antitoxin domain-containing protein [Solirubrobacterales bacterium]
MTTAPPVDGPEIPLYGGESARQRESGSVDRSLARLAARQHGVVALWQLADFGLSAKVVDKRVAAGRMHRIHQGVYAVGHPLLTMHGHRMAAVLACGSEAVLSHRSAAALWGIREDSRNRIDVTAPGRRGRIPAGIDAHRHGSLRPADRTLVDGIPCTSVSRTLLDLAAVVTYRQLRYAVKQAEVERLFDLASVNELLARSKRRRGIARLRRAIAHHDPREQLTRRELEARFLALCRNAGLPSPQVNGHLVVEGISMMPDFIWRDAGLIVEADSRKVHGTVTAFEEDRRRDQRLTAAGWTVIRCTWRQVLDEPHQLSRTIQSLLQRTHSG